MNYPKTLRNLIDCYKKLPGIGEKSAERLALATLNMDSEVLQMFSKSIKDISTKITYCKKCNNLAEGNLCEICKNEQNRDQTTICVVEEPKNIILFEKIGSYRGMYHVLGGLISPLDGINPDNLNIVSLIQRIKKEKIKEVIFAVRPSIEGETTTLYISKLLNDCNIKITKIAHGIPIGVDMEYIDSMTLEMALEDRKSIE